MEQLSLQRLICRTCSPGADMCPAPCPLKGFSLSPSFPPHSFVFLSQSQDCHTNATQLFVCPMRPNLYANGKQPTPNLPRAAFPLEVQ